jgi:hypothetical protein
MEVVIVFTKPLAGLQIRSMLGTRISRMDEYSEFSEDLFAVIRKFVQFALKIDSAKIIGGSS